MTYRAVIFDLFGTLIDNFRHDTFADVLRLMAEVLEVPADEFAAAVRPLVAGSLTGDYDIAGEAFLACKAIGHPRTRAQAALASDAWQAHMLQFLRPRPGAIATLVKVVERKLRVGLISDCADEIPRMWGDLPYRRFIDAPVFSCREGMTKPDPEIYERCCERLGVKPAEALYLGDTAREVQGALDAGLGGAVRILAPHESDTSHYWADRSPWDGPTITALPDLLPYLD